MIIQIRIPSPGESISEVTIANWLVADGDFVNKDQEIAEVESDKATLPLIAEASGQVHFKVSKGTTVKVGQVACEIDTDKIPETVMENDTKNTQEKIIKIKSLDQGNKSDKKIPIEIGKEKMNDKAEDFDLVKITPLAAKMMKENNLQVEDIIKGLIRITTREVQTVMNGKNLSIDNNHHPGSREEEIAAVTPLRKKLSERLVAVKNETAMLTTFNEVNMSRVIELKNKYQEAFMQKHGVKLGFMSFFVKAVVESLKLFPKLNSRFEGSDVISPKYYDIGIAVQTDKGLMVPVIQNTESLSLADIEKKIAGFAQKARANRLSISEITGGTFTITNGGVFGSLFSTPILNPPQSAILGMHSIMERPVAVNGKVEIHPMMYVALSYDHRMVDGKDSVSFLKKVKEFIESPYLMIYNGKNPENILLEI